MFTLAKAQFDLTMAWSELAQSTFAAPTMIANSGAKVVAASAAFERALQLADAPAQPWPLLDLPSAGFVDPLRLAAAWTEASAAFWASLLAQPKPKAAPAPLPLWWTAFTEPVAKTKPARPAPRAYLLH